MKPIVMPASIVEVSSPEWRFVLERTKLAVSAHIMADEDQPLEDRVKTNHIFDLGYAATFGEATTRHAMHNLIDNLEHLKSKFVENGRFIVINISDQTDVEGNICKVAPSIHDRVLLIKHLNAVATVASHRLRMGD